MVKKKKEIKIVPESDTNYTFLNAGFMNTYRNSDSVDDITNKTMSNIEKDALKARSVDSKKSKIRYKNRIAGGQIQQSHSSVYE
jgi:hypothetical protein